ncbi:MAG: hypothetical protein K8R90_05270 [Candidatus Cloacimonetes bacterium]|nr:hypothetical protein [Candidatus Cloacimonadota bacterium]
MQENENIELTTEEKFAAVTTLKKRLEDDFIALGSLLSEIKRTKAFRLRGYTAFGEFVEGEYNMSRGFASRLITIHDLFVEEMDVNETRLTGIGLDRLSIIKPVVKDCPRDEAEEWIGKAEQLTTTELREEVRTARDQEKKKTNKEIFVEQWIERMVTVFNCSVKELQYKLAIYFHDRDLDEVKDKIRTSQRQIEEAGDL